MKAFYYLFIIGIMVQTATSNNVSITFPKTSETEFSSQPVKHVKLPQYVVERQMVHNIANIGLKSLRELLTVHNNVVLSPFNIYSCLGVLSLGAAEETQDEIRSVLGPRNEKLTLSHIVRNRRGVSYASGIFLDNNYLVKEEFVNSSAAEYHASVMNFNFSQEEKTINFINKWVSDHTNGTISNLLDGSLDSNTKMIVVSALLFDGKWLQSFSPSTTIQGTFEIGNGEAVDVNLMHLSATVPIVRNPLLDAIGLPYQEEGMMMYVILPKTHGISALKKLLTHLNVNSLKKLKKESVSEEIVIILPKLKISERFSLTESLKKQGISSMFNPATANFRNIAEDSLGLFVSDIYHSIHFEINEEGTLASAATASILTKSKKFIFKANRPFIFVITDENDIVLFIGAILHP